MFNGENSVKKDEIMNLNWQYLSNKIIKFFRNTDGNLFYSITKLRIKVVFGLSNDKDN